MKIFIYDSEEELAVVLSEPFQEVRFQVTAVHKVQAAFQAIKSQQFDLLVSDVGLLEMRAPEARLIKEELRNQGELWLITTHTDADPSIAQAYGATRLFQKPIFFENYERAIQQFVAQGSGASSL